MVHILDDCSAFCWLKGSKVYFYTPYLYPYGNGGPPLRLDKAALARRQQESSTRVLVMVVIMS